MSQLLERTRRKYANMGTRTARSVSRLGSSRWRILPRVIKPSNGTTLDADGWSGAAGLPTGRRASWCRLPMPERTARLDGIWGHDEEGEVRDVWKRQGELKSYRVMGGHTQQRRCHRMALALQIKAAVEGVCHRRTSRLPPPDCGGHVWPVRCEASPDGFA